MLAHHSWISFSFSFFVYKNPRGNKIYLKMAVKNQYTQLGEFHYIN